MLRIKEARRRMGAAMLQTNGMAAVVTMRKKTPGIGGAKPGTKKILIMYRKNQVPAVHRAKI